LPISVSAAENSLVIATDLPLQGGAGPFAAESNNAIKLVLKQNGYKAGTYNIQIREYDNSTEIVGAWDIAKCASNAAEHVQSIDEVAVIGPWNSGCARIMLPIMNSADSQLALLSPSTFWTGLTKAWNSGEPISYFPSGVKTFWRVMSSEDSSIKAAAFYAKNIGIKSVYVLNDGLTPVEPYRFLNSIAQAKAFTDTARANGINVLSPGDSGVTWVDRAANYNDLFTSIKSLNPDAVFLAGIFDMNGAQLIRDKVRILGDNNKIKLIAPAGFTGYPDLVSLPESNGMFLVSPGNRGTLKFANYTNWQKRQNQLNYGTIQLPHEFYNKTMQEFKKAYLKEYGSEPRTSDAYYAAAATQVVLDAISRSDGTRSGVINQMRNVDISASSSLINRRLKFDENGDLLEQESTVYVVRNWREDYKDSIVLK
jgi:branched-chain amino acid transport system substrate-binding protein